MKSTNASRSTRDTAFVALATLVAGVAGNRLGLAAEEIAIANIVTFAAITFGYRFLRHYLPWVTEDDA